MHFFIWQRSINLHKWDVIFISAGRISLLLVQMYAITMLAMNVYSIRAIRLTELKIDMTSKRHNAESAADFIYIYIYIYIYIITGKFGCRSFITVQLMMRANHNVHYDPTVVFGCLYRTPHLYHHFVGVSEGIELHSITFHAIYAAVRIQLAYFSYDCENTGILTNYHRQIGSKTHFSLFELGRETMACVVPLFILLCGYYFRI